MNISIIGCGYVGLVSGACFSYLGHTVTCVDIDTRRIEDLRSGRSVIHEPELDELIVSGTRDGSLTFVALADHDAKSAEVVVIAVGTPSLANGDASLDGVFAAAESVALNLASGAVIAIKSTVPVGTCEQVLNAVRAVRGRNDISVVSNPEFLREGSAVRDFLTPDKIVIGADRQIDFETLLQVYGPLHVDADKIVLTDPKSAELGKYASNSFLAVKVSFINEIADLCAASGAEVRDVARSMALDPRIGRDFLACGPGFGGACFPKDSKALAYYGTTKSVPMHITSAAIKVNVERPAKLCSLVEILLGNCIIGRKICVLGLTFKANTDDVREAPAIRIAQHLMDRKAHVTAFDPAGMAGALKDEPRLVLADSAYEAADGADIVIFLTEWDAFMRLDFNEMANRMSGNIILDLRNMLPAESVIAAGLRYECLGRSIDVQADTNILYEAV